MPNTILLFVEVATSPYFEVVSTLPYSLFILSKHIIHLVLVALGKQTEV